MKFKPNSRVLIQCGDLVENKSRILPLADSLRMLGHKPIILHYNPSAFSFFASRGIDCVDLKQYRARVGKKDINPSNIAPAFFDDSFYPIFRVKHELQKLTRADLDRDLYMFRRDGVALTRLISDEDIDWIIVWNGVTGHVANALRIIGHDQSRIGGFLERGYLRNSVFFDHLGTNGASSISQGIGSLYERSVIDDSVAAARTFLREVVVQEPSIRDTGSKIIFVPLQVQLDSNILLYSDKIKTMRQLVFAALDLAKRLGAGWKVIVRDHPEEEQARLNIPYDERIVRNNVTSLDDMLEAASVVYTVNSTVGMTAAFKGKVVVCNGSGIYCNERFVINANRLSLDELAEAVHSSLEQPANMDDIIDYASVLLHRHLIYDSGSGNSPVFGKALKAYGDDVAGLPKANLLQRIQNRLVDAGNLHANGIGVDVRLTFGEAIPLTYRKSERASKGWISEALTVNFPNANFRQISQGKVNDKAGSICIVPADGPLTADLDGYLAVLDEFGLPHYNFYEKRADFRT